jgi:hypothetical protein
MGMLKTHTEKDNTQQMGWVATVILIVASGVNGLGFYPWGPLLLVLGGTIWMIIAIIRRDWPLIVTNAVMGTVGLATVIYTVTR